MLLWKKKSGEHEEKVLGATCFGGSLVYVAAGESQRRLGSRTYVVML